jgi:hypothetical protein
VGGPAARSSHLVLIYDFKPMDVPLRDAVAKNVSVIPQSIKGDVSKAGDLGARARLLHRS